MPTPTNISRIFSSYRQIDSTMSRSAQPGPGELALLKKIGVTDVIDFRNRDKKCGSMVGEGAYVKELGMNYHNIQTNARKPSKQNISDFIQLTDEIKNSGGLRKGHIHCLQGIDRTGFYSALYKCKHKIGTLEENINEMLRLGHSTNACPKLIPLLKKTVKGWEKGATSARTFPSIGNIWNRLLHSL